MWPQTLPRRGEISAFVLFRRFLALKVGAPLVLVNGIFGSISISRLSFLSVFAMSVASLRKYYQPGILILFCFSLHLVLRSWPFTINHEMLEALILALVLLESDFPREPKEGFLGIDT